MTDLLIVGDGVAGDTAARKVSGESKSIHVEVFTSEEFPFYQRTRIGDVVNDRASPDELVLHDESWYSNRGVELNLETTVEKISPKERTLTTADGVEYDYDGLLLAPGAEPFVPDVEGINKEGVFTLRTLNDALRIRSNLEGAENATVIGGGLLGLESAGSLQGLGIETTVVEVLPQLMGQQLDGTGAGYVKERLEEKGIRFRLETEAQRVIGAGGVEKVALDDGEELPADLVIVSAGVTPRTKLAEEAGVETERGILVDQNLRTSEAGIYAAGDAIEQDGRCHGIWPPAREQGEVAGENLVGGDREYDGSLDYYKLKVAEIDLISAGIREEDRAAEVVSSEDPERLSYKKFFLDGAGSLIGAILVGDGSSHSTVLNALRREMSFQEVKDELGIQVG